MKLEWCTILRECWNFHVTKKTTQPVFLFTIFTDGLNEKRITHAEAFCSNTMNINIFDESQPSFLANPTLLWSDDLGSPVLNHNTAAHAAMFLWALALFFLPLVFYFLGSLHMRLPSSRPLKLALGLGTRECYSYIVRIIIETTTFKETSKHYIDSFILILTKILWWQLLFHFTDD